MDTKEKAILLVRELNSKQNDVKCIADITKLGEVTKQFKVIDVGSVDEPFTFEINGLQYYDADVGSLEDENGTSEYDVLLKNSFTDEIDEIEDDIEEEIGDEILKKAIKRAICRSHARMVCSMNNAINEDWIGKVEKKVEEICSKIEGVRYDEWEELNLIFYIDGKRFSWQYNSAEIYDDEDNEYA